MKKGSKYEICGDYAKVFLNDGSGFFLCDIEDLEFAKEISWSLTEDGYARGWIGNIKKARLFHKMVFPIRRGFVTDHINRNRLDNRKSNLREVTIKENSNNKVNQQHLPAKGIRRMFNSKGERFVVDVKTNDCKTMRIGTFDTLNEAIVARDNAYLDIKGVPFPNI